MKSTLSLSLKMLPFLIGVLSLSGCVSQEAVSKAIGQEYSIVVNYDEALGDLLNAGKYDWTFYQITDKNFPSIESGSKSLRMTFVDMGPYIDIATALNDQASRGLRPATLKELLSFGQAYPDVQTKVALLGLGSHCDLIINKMEWFNWDMMQSMMVRSFETLYPYLAREVLGRTANLMDQESMFNYHNPKLYALFVILG